MAKMDDSGGAGFGSSRNDRNNKKQDGDQKVTELEQKKATTLTDSNMVYMGCAVQDGNGKARDDDMLR